MHRAGVAARRRDREELHAALRAAVGRLTGDLGVHRAGVDDRAVGDAHVHLGDECERLVGLCVDVRREAFPLCRPLGVLAQDGELVRERGRRRLVAHVDRRKLVRPLGRAVLEGQLARLLEERIDHDPLGGCEHDRLDELLTLDAAAVAADELQLGSWQRDVEDARVGRVREIEANHLAQLCGERRLRLAANEQDVAVAAHGGERRLLAAERRDLPVLDQDVVEGQGQLAVGGRPVVAFGRNDDDVAVLAELLAVVLADVRVVPVDTGVGERDAVGEAAAHRDRGLRLVGAVVAVLEPQTVPVNGRLEVAFVDDVDDEFGALADADRRTGHRAVVGDHANGVLAEALRDRRDPQLEPVAVAELDDLRPGRLGQARRLRREVLEVRFVLVVVVVMLVMFHRQIPSAAPAACGARLSFVSGAGSLPPPSCAAMKAASSATKPSSAEPRVCCQERPRK